MTRKFKFKNNAGEVVDITADKLESAKAKLQEQYPSTHQDFTLIDVLIGL